MGTDHHEHDEFHPKEYPKESGFMNALSKLGKIVDGPVSMFRERIIDPIRARNQYPYYHRQFPKVPTIDECDVDDQVCIYEANEQYMRDRAVDKQIVLLLSQRLNECLYREGHYDGHFKCAEIHDDYDSAITNYHIKYGELAHQTSVIDAFMKQKHRMIWQRRNPGKDIVGVEKRKEMKEKAEQDLKTVLDFRR